VFRIGDAEATQDQISRVSAMLTQEYGTASNIKSRVNRLSVLAAITSTQQRLKLYNRVPPNGLVLFVGTILTDEGKEKKVSFDFEPHKPINTWVIYNISLLPTHIIILQVALPLRQ
jgi:peptide chain release factor subunit 1